MSSIYEKMNMEELKKTLLELEDELEDIEDEKDMMLGQSGHHISSTRLATKYAGMLNEVNEKKDEVRKLIQEKE